MDLCREHVGIGSGRGVVCHGARQPRWVVGAREGLSSLFHQARGTHLATLGVGRRVAPALTMVQASD